MSCDLHTHSTFSDGTSTPEELVSAAQELGLTAVALCDHNDVDGLPRFLRAAPPPFPAATVRAKEAASTRLTSANAPAPSAAVNSV